MAKRKEVGWLDGDAHFQGMAAVVSARSEEDDLPEVDLVVRRLIGSARVVRRVTACLGKALYSRE